VQGGWEVVVVVVVVVLNERVGGGCRRCAFSFAVVSEREEVGLAWTEEIKQRTVTTLHYYYYYDSFIYKEVFTRYLILITR